MTEPTNQDVEDLAKILVSAWVGKTMAWDTLSRDTQYSWNRVARAALDWFAHRTPAPIADPATRFLVYSRLDDYVASCIDWAKNPDNKDFAEVNDKTRKEIYEAIDSLAQPDSRPTMTVSEFKHDMYEAQWKHQVLPHEYISDLLSDGPITIVPDPDPAAAEVDMVESVVPISLDLLERIGGLMNDLANECEAALAKSADERSQPHTAAMPGARGG